MPNGHLTVMVVRHAEKPDETPGAPPPFGVDELGQPHPESLIPRGWQRAGALAVLLGAASPAAPLVRPTVLLSPDYGKVTSVHRTTQTVTPLSRRLGVDIRTPVAKGEEVDLVRKAVLTEAGDVLICWEHHHIPAIAAELATALGIGRLPAIASTWPDDDFDSILVLSAANGAYAAAVVSQNALAGDGKG